MVQDTESGVCSSKEQKTGEIIQDNENAFSFRGQTVFIISHNHSWLPFNAGPAVFYGQKAPGVEALKGIGPPGCWHGDNCSLVHCVFYGCFLEDSKDVQFES